MKVKWSTEDETQHSHWSAFLCVPPPRKVLIPGQCLDLESLGGKSFSVKEDMLHITGSFGMVTYANNWTTTTLTADMDHYCLNKNKLTKYPP